MAVEVKENEKQIKASLMMMYHNCCPNNKMYSPLAQVLKNPKVRPIQQLTFLKQIPNNLRTFSQVVMVSKCLFVQWIGYGYPTFPSVIIIIEPFHCHHNRFGLPTSVNQKRIAGKLSFIFPFDFILIDGREQRLVLKNRILDSILVSYGVLLISKTSVGCNAKPGMGIMMMTCSTLQLLVLNKEEKSILYVQSN